MNSIEKVEKRSIAPSAIARHPLSIYVTGVSLSLTGIVVMYAFPKFAKTSLGDAVVGISILVGFAVLVFSLAVEPWSSRKEFRANLSDYTFWLLGFGLTLTVCTFLKIPLAAFVAMFIAGYAGGALRVLYLRLLRHVVK